MVQWSAGVLMAPLDMTMEASKVHHHRAGSQTRISDADVPCGVNPKGSNVITGMANHSWQQYQPDTPTMTASTSKIYACMHGGTDTRQKQQLHKTGDLVMTDTTSKFKHSAHWRTIARTKKASQQMQQALRSRRTRGGTLTLVLACNGRTGKSIQGVVTWLIQPKWMLKLRLGRCGCGSAVCANILLE